MRRPHGKQGDDEQHEGVEGGMKVIELYKRLLHERPLLTILGTFIFYLVGLVLVNAILAILLWAAGAILGEEPSTIVVVTIAFFVSFPYGCICIYTWSLIFHKTIDYFG
ncbi:MAG: hypothetical protein GY945_01575 [Rhodobacteraceae bacterium]|nr:hypothetical protein [Paracoccaceae bacterium]